MCLRKRRDGAGRDSLCEVLPRADRRKWQRAQQELINAWVRGVAVRTGRKTKCWKGRKYSTVSNNKLG